MPEGDCGGVPLPLWEMEPVPDADAPAERDGVGAAVTVGEALTVELGVSEGVPVPESVGDAVSAPLREGVAVPVLLSDALPDTEGEAPRVSDAVVLALTVELAGISCDYVAYMIATGATVMITEPLPRSLPKSATTQPKQKNSASRKTSGKRRRSGQSTSRAGKPKKSAGRR